MKKKYYTDFTEQSLFIPSGVLCPLPKCIGWSARIGLGPPVIETFTGLVYNGQREKFDSIYSAKI